MTGPRNDTGKWLLQLGCHRGTITSRDSEVTEHGTEAAARKDFADAERTWAKRRLLGVVRLPRAPRGALQGQDHPAPRHAIPVGGTER